MLYILSGHVKPGRNREYHKWLHDHREIIEKDSPEGWNLRGVYFTVFGLGEHLSEIHWDLDNYGSFEASAAQDRDSEFARIVEEWFDFLDLSNTRGRLLKDAYHEDTVAVAR
jgi:hypothetical protein